MVHEILREGRENAITSRIICETLNMTRRDLTATIERERRQGIPICASTGRNPGYYLAASKEEMQGYCRSIKKRAIELFKTRQACMKTIKTLPEERKTQAG